MTSYDDTDYAPFEQPEMLHAVHFDRSAPEARSLAYHEAGHAVVALSVGIEVFHATVRARYDFGGHVRHAKRTARGAMTVPEALLITLAGPAAQRRYFPLSRWFAADLYDPMGQSDMAQARALLRALHGSDGVSEDVITEAISRWRDRADRAVTRHWSWIVAVADALEQRQSLSGAEIASLNSRCVRR